MILICLEIYNKMGMMKENKFKITSIKKNKKPNKQTKKTTTLEIFNEVDTIITLWSNLE